MLAASDVEAKERCVEAIREEKRKVKRCIYQSKKKVNEQFERKVNEDVNGNRKLMICSNKDIQEQVAVHICTLMGFGEVTTSEETQ